MSIAQESEPEIGDSEVVTEDDVFTTLSNRRRRYTVHALDDGSTRELGPLAEQVAAWEYDVTVDELSHDERKRVYTALQQTHLPKMDDVGLVEFDKDRGTVEPTPALEDVDLYLEVVGGDEIPWSKYYLGLTGVAATLLVALWVNEWPFTVVSDLGWAAVIVAMLAVSAAVHHYYADSRRLGAGDRPPERRTGG